MVMGWLFHDKKKAKINLWTPACKFSHATRKTTESGGIAAESYRIFITDMPVVYIASISLIFIIYPLRYLQQDYIVLCSVQSSDGAASRLWTVNGPWGTWQVNSKSTTQSTAQNVRHQIVPVLWSSNLASKNRGCRGHDCEKKDVRLCVRAPLRQQCFVLF